MDVSHACGTKSMIWVLYEPLSNQPSLEPKATMVSFVGKLTYLKILEMLSYIWLVESAIGST